MNIENIPRYCINLKHRTDRWDNFTKEIYPVFKDVQRFEAVNGKELDSKTLDKLLTYKTQYNIGKDRTDHRSIYTLGAIGCYLSHINIWEKMVAENMPECIIFEDDVILNPEIKNQNVHFLMSNIIDESEEICKQHNKQLSLVFFSYTPRSYIDVNDNILKLNDFYGMDAYYITLYGAKELLKNAYPLEMQIDSYITVCTNLNPDLVLLAPKKRIFTQNSSFGTDIQTPYKGCDNGASEINLSLITTVIVLIIILIIILTYVLRISLQ